MSLFSKKPPKDSMPLQKIKQLNNKPVRSVTARDRETYKEIHLGGEGAVNIIGNEIQLVCGGVTVFACPLDEVKVGELMNHNGAVFKGGDRISGETLSVTAIYADKF